MALCKSDQKLFLSHALLTSRSVPHDPNGDTDQLDGVATQPGNANANVRALYIMKQKNRKLKTLISIGGGGSEARRVMMLNGVKSANNRKRFIKSAVQLMLDWGFDGIDLDYEYPQSTKEGEWFYTLVKELRAALNAKSTALGQSYRYILTAAVPAGQQNYKYFPLGKLNNQLDYFNLMAYDYSGNWGVTAHNSNLFKDTKNPKGTPTNTDDVVKAYIKAGVSASKIVLGMSLEAKVFKKTDGLGKKFSGFETAGFKTFPRSGATVYERPEVGAIITFDKKKKEVVSLEGSASVAMKTKYVKSKKLAGTFFWDVYSDKTGTSSLVYKAKLGLSSIDSKNNQLSYPTSKYNNIRLGMKSQKTRALRWVNRRESTESA